jgi:hypothetical protein
LFAQITEFVTLTSFSRIVARYSGDSGLRCLTCSEQFRVIAFAQLTGRESLQDIEVTLGANASKLYALGFRHSIHRSTLADANESRDWRIWCDLAAVLIRRARKLYLDEDLGLELKNTVYALDATTLDLCLSLFEWAAFRKAKAKPKVDRTSDIICDQSIALNGHYIANDYPETQQTLLFWTNNTSLPPLTIAALNKSR